MKLQQSRALLLSLLFSSSLYSVNDSVNDSANDWTDIVSPPDTMYGSFVMIHNPYAVYLEPICDFWSESKTKMHQDSTSQLPQFKNYSIDEKMRMTNWKVKIDPDKEPKAFFCRSKLESDQSDENSRLYGIENFSQGHESEPDLMTPTTYLSSFFKTVTKTTLMQCLNSTKLWHKTPGYLALQVSLLFISLKHWLFLLDYHYYYTPPDSIERVLILHDFYRFMRRSIDDETLELTPAFEDIYQNLGNFFDKYHGEELYAPDQLADVLLKSLTVLHNDALYVANMPQRDLIREYLKQFFTLKL